MKRKWPNRSGAPAGRDDKRLRFKGQPQGAIAGVLGPCHRQVRRTEVMTAAYSPTSFRLNTSLLPQGPGRVAAHW